MAARLLVMLRLSKAMHLLLSGNFPTSRLFVLQEQQNISRAVAMVDGHLLSQRYVFIFSFPSLHYAIVVINCKAL